MVDSIHRLNIDDCLAHLNDPDLPTDKRTEIVKSLLAEEDQLSNNHEQLQFAENRAAKGRELLSQLRYLRYFDHVDRDCADRLITTFETTQRLLENFCDQMLTKVMSSRL